VNLIAHSSQPNELQRIRIGIHMVYFSGFLEVIVRPIPRPYETIVIFKVRRIIRNIKGSLDLA
jgi:hypothetical protein